MFSRINRAFKKSRAEDGFTLIELLIVIVIIGILAAIAIPVFLNQQKAAINATVKSDVRNTTANVLLAINKVPTATGFVVYGPGDTLATTKMAGVPSSVITVPAGKAAVEAVRSRNNIIVINGSVSAGYEVIGCNPDTLFGWKFISNTGLFADAPDCAAIITAASAPAMNAPVTAVTGDGGSAVIYSEHLGSSSLPADTYFCVALLSKGIERGYPFAPAGASTFPPNPRISWASTVQFQPAADIKSFTNNEIRCEPYPGAIGYSWLQLYPSWPASSPIFMFKLSYGYQLSGPAVPFNAGNWQTTPATF